MPQSLFAMLPAIAVTAFVVTTLALLRGKGKSAPQGWLVPGGFAILFLAWSLFTVARERPLGFWPNHTANAWGNQVWFDLLLAIGCAWTLLLPRARAAGMRPLPWLLLLVCTGSIGLLAMFARCLFLENRPTQH